MVNLGCLVMSPLQGLVYGGLGLSVGARPYAMLCRPFGACIVIFCPNGSGRTPDRTRVPNKGWR